MRGNCFPRMAPPSTIPPHDWPSWPGTGERTGQILTALRQAPDNAAGLARRIYDVPEHLHRAASRNVLAHLLALAEIGAVETEAPITAASRFHPR